jgi:hypothetical protein
VLALMDHGQHFDEVVGFDLVENAVGVKPQFAQAIILVVDHVYFQVVVDQLVRLVVYFMVHEVEVLAVVELHHYRYRFLQSNVQMTSVKKSVSILSKESKH